MIKFLLGFLLVSITVAQTRITVPYTRFTLQNGLNVILHVDRTTPTVSVNTWYHVGSGYEKPGRTGFAHLFEHLMFEGSKDVPEGMFDQWLEAAGGNNNASTNSDQTNYYEDIPSNALELALFLDSDRMGYLLTNMTEETVNGQRDVVKNERRQSYENRPYGMASILLDENLFPPNHPYHWPTIGSMKDLSAASVDDVKNFFRTYYVPNNASLCIAGDIDVEKTKALVEKWFNEIPAGKPVPQQERTMPVLNEEKRFTIEDNVQLPRLYMAWISPASFSAGDAEMDMLGNILAGGKNSRLYKRLVYDLQIAQDVFAYQNSQRLVSSFMVVATARAGHTLKELETVIQQEIDNIKNEPPTEREVQRIKNQIEMSFYNRLENIGSFGGKADLLNNYFYYTGNPDYFNEDVSRYFALDGTDITAIAQTYLKNNGRVVLSVVPKEKLELSAGGELTSTEGK